MADRIKQSLMLFLLAAVLAGASAFSRSKIEFHYADHLEVIPEGDKQVWYAVG